MKDWGTGYVGDVAYSAGYYHDQAPAHLWFICLMNGFEPRPVDKPFNYLELGCGLGLTVNVLAATNPNGSFVGIDFNPSHIAEAEAIADTVGLENVAFYESSFEQTLSETCIDLPDFDIVTLHGVYSWVSPDDRLRIVEILRRKLKPGGIVYLSYNAMPGWSGGVAVQRLLYEYGQMTTERSDLQFERALNFLRTLHDADVAYFKDNRFFESILEIHGKRRLSYLTHEYINRNWQPLYHLDVSRELAEAKLQFVGSSHALDNFPDLNHSAERQKVLSQVPAADVRETVKDFCVPRLLRKDVFMRGARRVSLCRQEQLIGPMPLALVIPSGAATLDLKAPVGEIQVSGDAFSPVLDALAEGTRNMKELLSISGCKEKNGAKAIEIAGVLVGSGQAEPALPEPSMASRKTVRRLNLALARRDATKPIGEVHALASAEIGGAVPASGLEMRVYEGLLTGVQEDAAVLAEHVWQPLRAQSERLLKDGRVLETEEENVALLRDDIGRVLAQSLPLWRRIGCL